MATVNNVKNNSKNNGNNGDSNKKHYGRFTADDFLEFEPKPLNGYAKFERVDNKTLSLEIKEAFQNVFHELVGVYVGYQWNAQYGGITYQVFFYFEPRAEEPSDGKIRNLINLTNVSKDSPTFIKKNAIENKSKGDNFDLTDETKLLLSDFMFGGRLANLPENKKVWTRKPAIENAYNNNTMYRIVQHNILMTNNIFYQSRAQRVIVSVTGFDLKRIVSHIRERNMVVETYYDKATDSMKNITSPAKYEIRFVKPSGPDEFIMHIEQFDEEQVKKIAIKENPNVMFNTGNIRYW